MWDSYTISGSLRYPESGIVDSGHITTTLACAFSFIHTRVRYNVSTAVAMSIPQSSLEKITQIRISYE